MIPADKLPALTNGSVYTGRQALQHKLIDALGDQETSIAWLASKGVDKNLPVVEWKAETSPYNDLLSSAAMKLLLRNIGLSDQGSALFDEQISQRIFLDGMLSVWHGSSAEKQQ
jgi:protease-4